MRQIVWMGVTLYFITIFVGNVNVAFANPSIKTIFIENKGQWSESILFKSLDGRVVLRRNSIETPTAKLIFEGHASRIRGSNKGSGGISYYRGRDLQGWIDSAPFYGEVIYENVYDGIDLIVRGLNEGLFNIQWKVHPNGDPSKIKLFTNEGSIDLKNGVLMVGDLILDMVEAYQGASAVEVEYVVRDTVISFRVGDYDRKEDLLIDPSVIIGGASNKAEVKGIAFYGDYLYVVVDDELDSLKVNGTVFGTLEGMNDASVIVLRLDKEDLSVVDGAVIGGSLYDGGKTIAVSSSGEVYVSGKTNSTDFPIMGSAYDSSHNGYGDAFIIKMNSELSSLIASTYLGGSKEDYGVQMVLKNDRIYVIGYTRSSDFPTSSDAFDKDYNEGGDGFISAMTLDLSQLLSSTYFGGSSSDNIRTVVSSASGLYVGGFTRSSDFPVVSGAFDDSLNGRYDAFISKLDFDLSQLLAGTFLGGEQNDYCEDLAIFEDTVYVLGHTNSNDFPTAGDAYSTELSGKMDIYVSRFDSDLSEMITGTFIGGTGDDYAFSMEVDTVGVYLAGFSSSSDYPVTADAYDGDFNGGRYDVIVSGLNRGLSQLVSSTYIGGSLGDRAEVMGINAGNVYVAGYTLSPDFPANTFDTTWLKEQAGFVGRLDLKLNSLISTFLDSAYVGSSRESYGSIALWDDAIYLVGSTEGIIPSLGEQDTLHSIDADVIVLKLDANNMEVLGGMHLGGMDRDHGMAIEISSNGVYIGGRTSSPDFPITGNAYDTSSSEGGDIFVSKLNHDLTQLLSSTFLGGSSGEWWGDMAIGPDAIYIAGGTKSKDFPITADAYDDSLHGWYDNFISKLDLSLSNLLASTFVGGSDYEVAYNIAYSNEGIYIAGKTRSTDYPTTSNAYDTTSNGVDGFITKLDADLTTLLASTYFGGSGTDYIMDMVASAEGIYITGYTNSSDFPALGLLKGNSDLFVSKLDPDLTSVLASTRLGGSDSDRGNAITLYGGNVYVAGVSSSSDFPITPGAFDDSYGGNNDAVVLKLNSDLSTLLGSTYLGGSLGDWARDLEVSPQWVYVSGVTSSRDFPVTKDLGFVRGYENLFITGFDFDLTPVDQREKPVLNIWQIGNVIVVNLPYAAYVGYDLYSPNGKLLDRVSLGYFLAGKLEINLDGYPAGVYLIRLSIGHEIKNLRVLIVR